jgi:1,4-dihydroxy-2-naphthoyl-CoA synthase
MKTFDTILYEAPAEHVARIVLNRPETRNAQDTRLLYELHDMLIDPTGLPPEAAKALGARLKKPPQT